MITRNVLAQPWEKGSTRSKKLFLLRHFLYIREENKHIPYLMNHILLVLNFWVQLPGLIGMEDVYIMRALLSQEFYPFVLAICGLLVLATFFIQNWLFLVDLQFAFAKKTRLSMKNKGTMMLIYACLYRAVVVFFGPFTIGTTVRIFLLGNLQPGDGVQSPLLLGVAWFLSFCSLILIGSYLTLGVSNIPCGDYFSCYNRLVVSGVTFNLIYSLVVGPFYSYLLMRSSSKAAVVMVFLARIVFLVAVFLLNILMNMFFNKPTSLAVSFGCLVVVVGVGYESLAKAIGWRSNFAFLVLVICLLYSFRLLYNFEYHRLKPKIDKHSVRLLDVLWIIELYKSVPPRKFRNRQNLYFQGIRQSICYRHTGMNFSELPHIVETVIELIVFLFEECITSPKDDYEKNFYFLYYITKDDFNLNYLNLLLKYVEIKLNNPIKKMDFFSLKYNLDKSITYLFINNVLERPQLNMEGQSRDQVIAKSAEHIDTYSFYRAMNGVEFLIEKICSNLLKQIDFFTYLDSSSPNIKEMHRKVVTTAGEIKEIHELFRRSRDNAHPTFTMHLLPYAFFLQVGLNDLVQAKQIYRIYESKVGLRIRLDHSHRAVISGVNYIERSISLLISVAKMSFGKIEYCSSNFQNIFGFRYHLANTNIEALMKQDFRPLHEERMKELVEDLQTPYIGQQRIRYLVFDNHIGVHKTVALHKFYPHILGEVKIVSMVKQIALPQSEHFIMVNETGKIIGFDPFFGNIGVKARSFVGQKLSYFSRLISSLRQLFVQFELEELMQTYEHAKEMKMEAPDYPFEDDLEELWMQLKPEGKGIPIMLALKRSPSSSQATYVQANLKMEMRIMKGKSDFAFSTVVHLVSNWIPLNQDIVDGKFLSRKLEDQSPLHAHQFTNMTTEKKKELQESVRMIKLIESRATSPKRKTISKIKLTKPSRNENFDPSRKSSGNDFQSSNNRDPNGDSNLNYLDDIDDSSQNDENALHIGQHQPKHHFPKKRHIIMHSEESLGKDNRLPLKRAASEFASERKLKNIIFVELCVLVLFQVLVYGAGTAFLIFMKSLTVDNLRRVIRIREQTNKIIEIDRNLKQTAIAFLEAKLTDMKLLRGSRYAFLDPAITRFDVWLKSQVPAIRQKIDSLELDYLKEDLEISGFVSQSVSNSTKQLDFLLTEDPAAVYYSTQLTFMQLLKVIRQDLNKWESTSSLPLGRPLVYDYFTQMLQNWPDLLDRTSEQMNSREQKFYALISKTCQIISAVYVVVANLLLFAAVFVEVSIRKKLATIYSTMAELKPHEISFQQTLLTQTHKVVSEALRDEKQIEDEYYAFARHNKIYEKMKSNSKKKFRESLSASKIACFGMFSIVAVLSLLIEAITFSNFLAVGTVVAKIDEHSGLVKAKDSFLRNHLYLNTLDLRNYVLYLSKSGIASRPGESFESEKAGHELATDIVVKYSRQLMNYARSVEGVSTSKSDSAFGIFFKKPCTALDISQIGLSLDDCLKLGNGASSESYMKLYEWTRLNAEEIKDRINQEADFDTLNSESSMQQFYVNYGLHSLFFQSFVKRVSAELTSKNESSAELLNTMIILQLTVAVLLLFLINLFGTVNMSEAFHSAVIVFDLIPHQCFQDNGAIKTAINQIFNLNQK